MVKRTQIETALDEIISNEEGMTFQGLAVALAKQRWRELIASERHKDLGLDAYASGALSPGGIGKALACSVTGEAREPKFTRKDRLLPKIKSDIQRFRPHFEDVQVLIFATPHRVTNLVERIWARAVREQFAIELIVLSREDILTDLMLPPNAQLCRSFLGIQIDVPPTVTELLDKTLVL